MLVPCISFEFLRLAEHMDFELIGERVRNVASGSHWECATVRIIDDQLVEDMESFSVNFVAQQLSGAEATLTTNCSVTIIDNDEEMGPDPGSYNYAHAI